MKIQFQPITEIGNHNQLHSIAYFIQPNPKYSDTRTNESWTQPFLLIQVASIINNV